MIPTPKGTIRIPGLVDMHVHLREPGFGYKERIFTGSRAAAAGGFTAVCSMPNVNPVPDSAAHLQIQNEIIERDSAIDIIPFASITKGRKGDELLDYASLAPYVAGFSDDGSGVQSDDMMRRAMQAISPTGKILAAHCEVESLLRGGYVHDSECLRSQGFKGICSESEWREIERDIRLAEETGCRLHICHISTKEGVSLVREAKKRGVKVTAETAPHYLAFCDEDVKDLGRFKMNPPLRSRADLEALREGVAEGTIDVIATDHAPHSIEEKSRGLAGSAMGVVGLETAFAAVFTLMVKTGLMPWERLIDAMALRPRQILGLPLRDDDYAVVDLDEEWEVRPEDFISMGKATPFEGMRLFGKIKETYCKGKRVYPDETGKI